MKANPFQRLDQALRHLLPFCLTLLLVLIDAMPTRLPGFAMVAPLLPLIGVYYWSIHRPELLPPSSAFLLGLVNDIIGGTPLGVTALVFLVLQGLASSQRRFFLGKPFLVAWWGFTLVAIGSVTAQWVLVSLLFGRSVDFLAVLFELLMTLFCYPLFSWLFSRTQLALLRSA